MSNTIMQGWHTQVCVYQGNVYTRDVGPHDRTVYMDSIHAEIPFRDDKPDTAQVQQAVIAAETIALNQNHND